MRKVEQGTKLDLERIVFIGRTFEEYMAMFLLSSDELKGKKVLDCPAGACSFTAVGNKQGLDITACDIAYDHASEDLKSKGIRDIEYAIKHMEQAKGNYVWDYFNDVNALRNHRLNALHDCSDDMKQNNERYIPVTLPFLPFHDDEFDVVLSAHFLFMYGDRLDYEFHLETVNELLRVTKKEIRIFPLVNLEGKRYEHLNPLKRELVGKGYFVEEKEVPYEFQKNANSMMIIHKAKQ
ncbi:SAM-dependent methyltransferase [Halalkalibacter alkaliphilus]|uniref:SAM-dependent methyltransferase n=1 Tax=Halalkalibacter alkaliphilus TaxID=2917993 RepID=A0A9X2CV50_9BACI|nr:SAM-dependent methyltransferase [Halalkalibacter alkaliphilus]MCL7748670.1 SAM-dependent methyltransferase [Halalkalibacter alkaliphilus]